METEGQTSIRTIPLDVVARLSNYGPFGVDYRTEIDFFATEFNRFDLRLEDFPPSAMRPGIMPVTLIIVANQIDATTAEMRDAIRRERFTHGSIIEMLYRAHEDPDVWAEKPATYAIVGSTIMKDGLEMCPLLSADFHTKTAELVLAGGERTVWPKGTFFPVIEQVRRT